MEFLSDSQITGVLVEQYPLPWRVDSSSAGGRRLQIVDANGRDIGRLVPDVAPVILELLDRAVCGCGALRLGSCEECSGSHR